MENAPHGHLWRESPPFLNSSPLNWPWVAFLASEGQLQWLCFLWCPAVASASEYAHRGLDRLQESLPILQQPTEKVSTRSVDSVLRPCLDLPSPSFIHNTHMTVLTVPTRTGQKGLEGWPHPVRMPSGSHRTQSKRLAVSSGLAPQAQCTV